jgi:hypothetical protein
MIDVKQAVKTAIDYFKNLYADSPFSNLLLEEVELTEDETYWLITLSYSYPTDDKLMSAIAPLKRGYKTLKINASTGEVISMKIRTLEYA